MNDEIKELLDIIKQATASVIANLETHQRVQAAVMGVEEELNRLYALENASKTKAPAK